MWSQMAPYGESMMLWGGGPGLDMSSLAGESPQGATLQTPLLHDIIHIPPAGIQGIHMSG